MFCFEVWCNFLKGKAGGTCIDYLGKMLTITFV